MKTSSSLPSGYVRWFHYRLPQWPLLGASILLFFLAFPLFVHVRFWLVHQPLPDTFRLSMPSWLLLVVIGGPVLILLHEGAHGFAIRWMGHRPRYGFRWLYAYATADGAVFTRNQYLLVALAPLLFLTPVGLALLALPSLPGWEFVAFFLAANVAGSVGDLWTAMKCLRMPAYVRVVDRASGFDVFGPPEGSVSARGRAEMLLQWVGTTLLLGMGLFSLVYLMLPLLVWTDLSTLNLSPWLVYHKTGDSFSMELRFWPFVVMAAPVSAGWMYWRARRRSRQE